ncbi:MAG: hypothetical protein JRG80_12920 [Deltaproteobacteria bacterium]|nr:hypothetical protein [Deltaproteobacteria bacterium]MBW2400158.1 hypothetical protein [Deltaproteobacteria bacterium]MBW2666015.1 hypothetical protein [Deltaproteobacteria bacterium]
MRPFRKLRVIALTIATSTSLLAPGTAVADLQAWDQEAVSALASDLAEAIKAVRGAALKEPTLRDRSNTTGRSTQQYLDTLKQLEQATRRLATRLGDGEDREKTLNLARRIGTLLRDAQESGRRLMLTQSSFDEIDRAVAVIRQLSPFYTDRDPLMPTSTQR